MNYTPRKTSRREISNQSREFEKRGGIRNDGRAGSEAVEIQMLGASLYLWRSVTVLYTSLLPGQIFVWCSKTREEDGRYEQRLFRCGDLK